MNASEEIAQGPTSAPPTAETITPARRRILYVLVAAHVVLGVVAARSVHLSWPTPSVVLFLAYFLGAAGLLGLWAGLSVVSPLRRLAGVALGILYLWTLPFISIRPIRPDEGVMFLVLGAFSVAPAFLSATLLARFKPRLRLVLADERTERRSPVQITTRFLFCFTAAFAGLLMIYELFGKYAEEIAIPIVLSFSLGWIGWAAAVATLLPRRVVLPVLAVIGTCSLVGAVPPRYLHQHLGPHAQSVLPWMALAACQASITVATLLVVRLCGYRLVPTADASREGPAPVPDSLDPLA